MKLPSAIALLSLFAATALCQSGVADKVKQRARRLSDENNARQGVAPPAPRAQSAAPAVDPVLKATQENIAGLQQDFADLKPDPAAKEQLLNHLRAAAHGAKPSDASSRRLADDLVVAASHKNFTDGQRTKLAQNIHALYNSSRLSTAQRQILFDETQKALLEGGVSAPAAEQVMKDIRKIAAETK